MDGTRARRRRRSSDADDPLRLLEDAFQEAVEERICHLFTIVGAAGVGKSRVVEEFIGSLGDQAQVASGRCLAYGQGITYWPVAEAIRDGAGIAEDDAPEAAAGAPARGARRGAGGRAGRLPSWAACSGSRTAPRPPTRSSRPSARRSRRWPARQPLILVFDDIHWGEPTFLDLVEHIADWTRDAPILLIAMARAELLEKRPTWGGGKRWVTTMSLEPLSDVESEELVTSLLGRADLPAEFRTHISHAAEGQSAVRRRAARQADRRRVPGAGRRCAGRLPGTCASCRCRPRSRPCWRRGSTGWGARSGR